MWGARLERLSRQVVVPVGSVPASVLPRYHSLIERHRQVELQLVRSFYKEQQKSPFKFLPWKNGALHFRFVPVSASAALPSRHLRLPLYGLGLQKA